LAIISLLFAAIIEKSTIKQRQIVWAVLITAIMALSMRTIIRNENWRNGLRLYSHDAAIEALISPQGSFDLEIIME